jgi:NADH-quinone oxidoreductase subunit E
LENSQKELLTQICSSFKVSSDELIPLMEAVQKAFGYLSQEVMISIARYLKVPEGKVFGVATFYALFRLSPCGKKIIKVCRGTACHVRRGADILQEVQKQIGIKPGETSEDLEYSLETISCFGSCALAPVIVVNKTVYGRMTPARVGTVLGISAKESKDNIHEI